MEYVLQKETALVVRNVKLRTDSLLSDCTEKEFPHRYVLRDKVYAKVNTLASNCPVFPHHVALSIVRMDFIPVIG